MKKITHLFIINFFVILMLISCIKNEYPRIEQLVYEDSLAVNISLFKHKVNRFFKKHSSQSLKKLWLVNGQGGFMYSYYQLGNESHIRAGNIEEAIGWIKPEPLIEDIGRLKSLKVLSLSNIGLHELPSSITQLQNLKDLNISFNDKLNWEDIISTVNKLPHLKVIRLYGMHIDHNKYQQLRKIKKDLEIRYNLDQFKEDMRKWFDYDEYTPSN